MGRAIQARYPKSQIDCASQNALWATYSSMYGQDNGGVYVVFTPLRAITWPSQIHWTILKFHGVGEDVCCQSPFGRAKVSSGLEL